MPGKNAGNNFQKLQYTRRSIIFEDEIENLLKMCSIFLNANHHWGPL